MDTGGSEGESGGTLGALKRACDQCRLRKIKCDKRSPCSNCQSSQIICRCTGAGQKPREQRRRVLISSEYERKIDLIERRLAGIEEALRMLKPSSTNNTSTTPTPNVAHPTPTSGGITSSASSIVIDQQESSPAFEGNSSLSAHSAYASEFLESAMSRGALRESSPKMAAALSTFKQIVSMQTQNQQSPSLEVKFSSQKLSPGTGAGSGSGIRDSTMPPMEAVISLLRTVKENPSTTSFFTAYCSFMTLDDLTEKCREVYFCTDDYSPATFIIVNGALYNLFLEFSFTAKGNAAKEAYQNYLRLCRNNLESALASLNLLLPATKETIEAITLGAMHAIEISKPSFAWTLTSTAAQLCQTLGYHRASSMEHDSQPLRQRKLRVFWTVYCLNKALSLRLGRASVIQDYDISLPTEMGELGIEGPWKDVFPLWVRLAMIQGKVYELLYSPVALCQSESERVAQAQRLAMEMRWGVMEPFERLNIGPHNISEINFLCLKSDEVSRLSILTLIYRAIPPQGDSPSTFVSDCIKTARKALETHQACMTSMKESPETLKCSYMHWTILYAPFIPFIVLFCHIIESSSNININSNNNSNPESSTETGPGTGTGAVNVDVTLDLNRLEDFVLSLDPLTPFSEAISKLHRLCQVLVNIARLYIEAKTKAKMQSQGFGQGPGQGYEPGQGQNQNQDSQDQGLVQMGEEFDVYLSALGFAPGFSGSGSGSSLGPGPGHGLVEGIGYSPLGMGTGTGIPFSFPSSVLEGNGPGHGPHDNANTNANANSTSAMFQSMQLGNWFSGNRYMMGLLEEDLSRFDPGCWS